MMISLKKGILTLALITASMVAIAPEQVMCYKPVPSISLKQLQCLATNVYHEARGEPWKGQVLVARVTLNRAKESSICEVVHEYKQFSWTLNPKPIKDWNAYTVALQASRAALNLTHDATHFHAIYVKPRWSQTLTKIEQVGNHVFYH